MVSKRKNSGDGSSPKPRAKTPKTTPKAPEQTCAQKRKKQFLSEDEFGGPQAKKTKTKKCKTPVNVVADSDVAASPEKVNSTPNSDDESLTAEEIAGVLGTPVRAPGESVGKRTDIEKREMVDRKKQAKRDKRKAAAAAKEKPRRDETNIDQALQQAQTNFGEQVNGKGGFTEFGGGKNHTPSKKALANAWAVHGPSSTAKTAPKGREAYNVQYQGFPTGEIEFGRPSTAHPITWLAIHTADEVNGHILFSSADYLLGGPYCFLSRHEKARFTIPEHFGTQDFSSVEHFVLVLKASCTVLTIFHLDFLHPRANLLTRATDLELLPERISKRVTPELSSKHLYGAILACDGSAGDLVLLSTAFDDFRQSDPVWYNRWLRIASVLIGRLFRLALRARYEQHPEAKIKLMMTGTYGLGEATSFGIGFSASQALNNRANWRKSTLGLLTEQLREDFRAEEAVWPNTYAFDYFQAMEENHPAKIKDRIKPTTESQVAYIEKLTKAYRDWLVLGGEKLMEHIGNMRKHAAKVLEDEKTACAKAEADRREATKATLAAFEGMRNLNIKWEDQG